jgi:antirestriction protein
MANDTMRVYVGTYAKYNSGSLKGEWLDLEDFNDKDEFYEKCREIHADESDPEFMFQDWEDIPDALISESSINEKAFELAALEEDDREMWAAYIANCGECDFATARDNYRGKYDSGKDFAEEWAIETGLIEESHPMFAYIDWEHYWNGDLSHSFFESNGHYFYNN